MSADKQDLKNSVAVKLIESRSRDLLAARERITELEQSVRRYAIEAESAERERDELHTALEVIAGDHLRDGDLTDKQVAKAALVLASVESPTPQEAPTHEYEFSERVQELLAGQPREDDEPRAQNGEPCDCQTPGDWHRVAGDFQRAMFEERARADKRQRGVIDALAILQDRSIGSPEANSRAANVLVDSLAVVGATQPAAAALPVEGEAADGLELLRDALLLAVIEERREGWVLDAGNDIEFDHLFERKLAESSEDQTGEHRSYPTAAGVALIVEALKAVARSQQAPSVERPVEGEARIWNASRELAAAYDEFNRHKEPGTTGWMLASDRYHRAWRDFRAALAVPVEREHEVTPVSYDPQAAMMAVLRAYGRVRDGQWVKGAATHVFAELLTELQKAGWWLTRSGEHEVTPEQVGPGEDSAKPYELRSARYEIRRATEELDRAGVEKYDDRPRTDSTEPSEGSEWSIQKRIAMLAAARGISTDQASADR